MQVGWVPRAPDAREVPHAKDGTVSEWQFHDDQLVGLDQAAGLLREFEASQAAHLWKEAASHFCGDGLEGGGQ